MNEIRVEKKESGNQWIWWVLGLLVLALIVWWIVSAMDDDDGAYDEEPVVMQLAPADEVVHWERVAPRSEAPPTAPAARPPLT